MSGSFRRERSALEFVDPGERTVDPPTHPPLPFCFLPATVIQPFTFVWFVNYYPKGSAKEFEDYLPASPSVFFFCLGSPPTSVAVCGAELAQVHGSGFFLTEGVSILNFFFF